jgi:hypothetical protein
MAFPSYSPTSRAFNAGDYSYKKFTSQSGKEIRILYGDKRTGMELELEYENIPDTQADDFITHYDEVKGGFNSFVLPSSFRTGWTGDAAAIDAASGNQWRYGSPPDIRSVSPGISSVSVKLMGVL